jgi:hypothetical protein
MMNKFSPSLRIFVAVCFTLACAVAAQAQATRTWVSGVGDDLNPCSRTAPCKTFAGAVSKTAAGGEINALDPGGYGAVTLTKSMTIDGNSTHASILASGTTGVSINDSLSATPGTAVVTLRNLSINGAGTTLGTNGVSFTAGRTVTVENCVIFNFSTNAIRVNLTTNGNLKVLNTSINNITVGDGINMTTTTGQVLATIENSRITNCASDGIEAVSRVRGAISNSVLTHSTTSGIKTSGTDSILNVDDVVVSYSTTGVISSAGSTINLSDSIIAQNGTGVNANGGTMNSFQGNSLISNGAPGIFSSTTAKQ